MNPSAWLEPLRRRPAASVWLAAFAGYTLAGVTSWFDPPYWDTVLGFMHQAIWLAEHQFDVPGLFAQPGYLEGGPLIYDFNLYPYGLAAGLEILGSGPAMWGLQHLLQFAWSATAVALTFVGLRRHYRGWVLWGPLLLMAAHPLMLSQSRAINAEPVMMCCTAGMLLALDRRRFGGLLVWLLIGRLYKDLVLVPALACSLAGLILLARTPRAWLYGLVTASGYFWWQWLHGWLDLGLQRRFESYLRPDTLWQGQTWFTRLPAVWEHAPAVYSLLYAGALIGLVAAAAFLGHLLRSPEWRARWRSGWRQAAGDDTPVALLAAAVCLLMAVSIATATLFVPRYGLTAFPAAIWLLAWGLHRMPPVLRRVPVVLMLAAALADAGGFLSRLLSDQHAGNNGMILERSLEYLDDLRVNQEVARRIDAAYTGATLLTWWPLSHQLSRPEYGYVTRRHPVISLGRPCMVWDNPVTLPEWVKQHPGQLDQLLFVVTSNLFNPGILVAPSDQILEEVVHGSRRVYLLRKPIRAPSSVDESGGAGT